MILMARRMRNPDTGTVVTVSDGSAEQLQRAGWAAADAAASTSEPAKPRRRRATPKDTDEE